MIKNLLTILLVAALAGFGDQALPPIIKLCGRNSPSFAECFKTSMEALKPLLKTGQIAPGFKIDGIEPLFIGDIAVSQGFDIKLTNLNAYGVSNFKVEKIRTSVDKLKFEFLLSVPKITTTSGYSLSWVIGLLNIQGAGDAFATLENVKIVLKMYGSRYQKNGETYVKIDDAKVEIKPAKISVRFENLFNGQKGLEDVANEAINQNIQIIANDVIPQVELKLLNSIKKTANQVFERAPENEFFP